MSLGSDDVALEYQRYGRNKETLINNTYIESGEYRRKFDSATDVPEVNRSIYQCSKAALKHRSGSVFEDMYWIDGKNGKVILSVTDSSDERAIIYTDNIKKTISGYNDIITVHSHPSSMPPSIAPGIEPIPPKTAAVNALIPGIEPRVGSAVGICKR